MARPKCFSIYLIDSSLLFLSSASARGTFFFSSRANKFPIFLSTPFIVLYYYDMPSLVKKTAVLLFPRKQGYGGRVCGHCMFYFLRRVGHDGREKTCYLRKTRDCVPNTFLSVNLICLNHFPRLTFLYVPIKYRNPGPDDIHRRLNIVARHVVFILLFYCSRKIIPSRGNNWGT